MSNLIEHAKKELRLLGEDRETADGLVRVVQAFSDMGHSGASAVHALGILELLLQFRNLTPITSDPSEWVHHTAGLWDGKNGVWQSKRNSRFFSEDGGVTYWSIDDKNLTNDERIMYTSVPHATTGDNDS